MVTYLCFCHVPRAAQASRSQHLQQVAERPGRGMRAAVAVPHPVKTALAPHCLTAHSGPRRSAADSMFTGVLEAPGAACEQWLLSPAFQERLFAYFPCADPPASPHPQVLMATCPPARG